MKHGRKYFLTAALTAALCGVAAAQPSDLAAQIERAHGGEALRRLENYEVRGTVEFTDRDSGLPRTTPFLLSVAGDRSRLELDGRVWIAQGVFGQWWEQGGARSTPRRLWEGLRDVYLTPQFSVSRLGQYEGGVVGSGRVAYHRMIARRTHYGYRSKAPRIELDFHPQTLLLAEALFTTEESGQTPVRLRYFDYENHQGVLVPSRVERQVGDNAPQIFRIDSVRFNTRPDDADFQIVQGS